MSIFGGLYVASSGLIANQDAINTTAHNLANLNSVGYSRQLVELDDKGYSTIRVNSSGISNFQIGTGTYYSLAKQVRDVFLDKTYRTESGREEFYKVAQETLEEVEDLLGEPEGEAFQSNLNSLWTSIQELAKDPSNSVYQTMFVQYAQSFMESAKTVYSGLVNFQNNLDNNVVKYVDSINAYGQRIAQINTEIRKIETSGVEHANDLRDERNLLLDELSKLIDIDYKEDLNGNVNILIEGEVFVNASKSFRIDTQKDPNTGFHTPYWAHRALKTVDANGREGLDISSALVVNMEKKISSSTNTDIGGLKASMAVRGSHKGTYLDLGADYENTGKSLLMNIQAEFDSLVHNVTTAINEVLMTAAGMKTGDILGTGTEVKYFEDDPSGYMRLNSGEPVTMFTLRASDGFSKVTGADGKDYWVLNEEDGKDMNTVYTIESMEVSTDLLQKPSLMGFIKPDKNIDYDTAEALKNVFDQEIYTLNPTVATRFTIMNHYNALVSDISNVTYVYNALRESQESTLSSIEDARDEVMGVASDDELTNLIKYQNAYNASSRYLNAINEMIEHMINSLYR